MMGETWKTYREISMDGETITPETVNEGFSDHIPGWKIAIGDFLKEWWNEKPYIQIKTSGSTGTPKIIRIEKEKMVNSAKMTGNFFGWKGKETVLLCLPAGFIAGRMMLVRSMVRNLQLLTAEPLVNPLEKINFSSVDFAAMIPLQVFSSIENNPEKIEKIKTLIIGGGEVSYTLHEKIKKLSCSCYATYGMTETITHVALKKLNGKNAAENFEALPGIHFSVDERNCLCIKAPMLLNELLVTNDIVELVSATSFRWLGRWDNVINTGGKKIFPEQLEKKCESLIDYRFFFAALADEALGQQLVLVVESGPFPADALLARLRETLHPHEMPKKVLFSAVFAETSTGKINRGATLQKAAPLL